MWTLYVSFRHKENFVQSYYNCTIIPYGVDFWSRYNTKIFRESVMSLKYDFLWMLYFVKSKNQDVLGHYERLKIRGHITLTQ